MAFDPGTDRPIDPILDRRRPANDRAGTQGEMAHDGVADRAGGVVVIDVDAIGAEFGEPHVDIFTPVIDCGLIAELRSEEHTSELQSLMRISYAGFCLNKNTKHENTTP